MRAHRVQMAEGMTHVHLNSTESTSNAKDMIKIRVDELITTCSEERKIFAHIRYYDRMIEYLTVNIDHITLRRKKVRLSVKISVLQNEQFRSRITSVRSISDCMNELGCWIPRIHVVAGWA